MSWLRTRLLVIVVIAGTALVLIVAGSLASVVIHGSSWNVLVAAASAGVLAVAIAFMRAGLVLDVVNDQLMADREREVQRRDEAERHLATYRGIHTLLEKLPDAIAGKVEGAVAGLIDTVGKERRGVGAGATAPPARPFTAQDGARADTCGVMGEASEHGRARQPVAVLPEADSFVYRSKKSLMEQAAADAERQWTEVVLHLARRLQPLIRKALAYVDDLENDIEDEVLLKSIFRVDHGLVLAYRRAESIVMLLGSTIRRFSRPQDTYEVMQSGVSMIEHYKRVDLPLRVAGAIVGEAAQEVSLMLAELLENATVFSPPNTRVRVMAERVDDALRIDISDTGLPVPPEVLARLTYLLTADRLKVSDLINDGRTGLSVVAFVARRYNIKVTLTPHASGNHVVLVLPAKLLVKPPTEPVPAAVSTGSQRSVSAAAEPHSSRRRTGPVASTYSTSPPQTGTAVPQLPRRRISTPAEQSTPQGPSSTEHQAQGEPPPLPRRSSGSQHMVPELRQARHLATPPPAGDYDPNLMAAFQQGHATGQDAPCSDTTAPAQQPAEPHRSNADE